MWKEPCVAGVNPGFWGSVCLIYEYSMLIFKPACVWSGLNMLQRVHLVERLLSLFDRQVVESDEITDNTPSVPSGTKLQS
uniref:Uncharacterized protein n=1 Tax=Aegilops tauschii subsp. strangulata TaxID=200361 RepID=A0A453IKG6_AEGTS